MKALSRNLTVILVVAIGAIIGTVYASTNVNTETKTSSLSSTPFMMGHVTLTVVDENGYVKAYRQSDNLITNVGLNALTNNLFTDLSDTTPQFDNIALGTSSASITYTNTILGAEITASCSRTGTNTSADGGGASGGTVTISVDTSFSGSSCTGTGIVEAGIFNSATANAGTLFARNSFTSVNLGSADTLTINWDLTFSDT